jgi:hypothetical protein
MILTGENGSIRRINFYFAIWSTSKVTWAKLGLNPGLRGESSATNHLRHGFKETKYPELYLKNQVVPHSKHTESQF